MPSLSFSVSIGGSIAGNPASGTFARLVHFRASRGKTGGTWPWYLNVALLSERGRFSDNWRMETSSHAFDFLAQTPEDLAKAGVPAVCVLAGDDSFLRKKVTEHLNKAIQGDASEEMLMTRIPAKTAQWRDVRDELSTASLFGPSVRVVLIDDADEFVSEYRSRLEDHVASPSATSVLILAVKTWLGNTRLAKSVAKTGWTIACKMPEKPRSRSRAIDVPRLIQWLVQWAADEHAIKLGKPAAQQLVDLSDASLGVMDQSLAKLAVSVEDPRKTISPEAVVAIVGGWRTRTTWELIDAACEGNAADALVQLDHLLSSGEQPIALFGAISWSLRRFAVATRNVQAQERDGASVRIGDALTDAGFRRFPHGAIEQAQKQLLQMGRLRAGRLQQWLLEMDLQLKGSHSAPDRARFALERLILRLAKETDPRKSRKTPRSSIPGNRRVQAS